LKKLILVAAFLGAALPPRDCGGAKPLPIEQAVHVILPSRGRRVDTVARLVMPRLSESRASSFVIETQAALGTSAPNTCARGPTGYTLMVF